jgi:(1->4)-alpha-D-glucan 1-alpha-D-glucosylmutase
MPTPRATYRLQLRPDFDFDAAAAVADYLAALGVSHLYASPYLQAAAGSTHGYDVVDPGRVNAELGGEAGHDRLQEALARAGLGQVLDIVPNHMAITGPENRWWWDVLRHGPAGRYAPYFDVDWDPPESKLRNQVLMPILGDHYGRELEGGALRLVHDDGEFSIRYHEHVLPVAPRSLGPVLLRAAAGLAEAEARAVDTDPEEEPEDGLRSPELAFLARALEDLPEPGLADERARDRRRADVAVIDARLSRLIAASPEVRVAVQEAVTAVNEDAGALDELLAAQNYRLAFWRTGGQELDYRRFFDIDTLAALRTEDPQVFEAVHGLVLDWLASGVLDGVRVDHPDGLRRPGEYFQRLRDAAPQAWIVAEKILMPDETLPDWPVDGTTGYDLLNDVTGLFLDPDGETPLTALWAEFTGDARPYEEVAYEARKDVLRAVLAAEVNRLANIFVNLCESRRRYRDFTRRELRSALREVAACFPVYRAYTGDGGPEAEREATERGEDWRVIEQALAEAKHRRPDIDGELLDFLRSVLLGQVPDNEARGLRMRFQQLTGPVAAKGEEDTAFYRYNRFVALNEVGGEPGRWGVTPDRLHERLAARASEQPLGMTTLSTHDTKRSEDVRARLTVLSEIPDRWGAAVREWRERNAEHWGDVEPDPRAEYLLYQTLVGAWPLEEERAAAYIEKAAREAKLRTSWTEPDSDYERALRGFVAGLYRSDFPDELAAFVDPLVPAGRLVSMAQKLVQLMAPGVPDLYQGTELWDLSLVDPDNRRSVDFEARRTLLDGLGDEPSPSSILRRMDTGLPKLWVVRQALAVRSREPSAFGPDGDYRPLRFGGDAAGHVFGFVRGGRVAVVVPRMVIKLSREGGWRDTRLALPVGGWSNVLTGEIVEGGAVRVSRLLGRFPVALLVKDRG